PIFRIAFIASGQVLSPTSRPMRSAAAPVTCGAAKLVPLPVWVTAHCPDGSVVRVVMLVPGAATSGFSRSPWGLHGSPKQDVALIASVAPPPSVNAQLPMSL